MSYDIHQPWCSKGSFHWEECRCLKPPREIIKKMEEEKERLKKTNPKEYRKYYCGLGM